MFKIDFKAIIIVILLVVVIFFPRKEEVDRVIEIPYTIEVPIDRVVKEFDTIYKPSPIEYVENPINDSLVESYNKAKDSISKLNLYIDAITIREYVNVFEDSIQSIEVYSKSQGKLIKQTVNYDLFERTVVIDSSVSSTIKSKPKLYFLGELGVPIMGNNNTPKVKVGLMLQNKNYIYSTGIDTDGILFLGGGIKL